MEFEGKILQLGLGGRVPGNLEAGKMWMPLDTPDQ